MEERKEQARPTATETASSWAAAHHTTPVEPLEHLVSEEDIRRGEQAGARRSKDPGFLRFFAILNGGLILTALAIVLFKTPNHFAFGGTSGVSVILSTLFPTLPVGAFMWIINIVLVVLGFIFLERKAILWSVFASFALSGYVSLFEMLFPGASTTSITGDMWLDLCFAVILPAIGSAMVFDIGASTGGFTDCMLQNGARRVYAVDVGYGQLDWKLRSDERVVCLERTNARYLGTEQIPEPLDFASIDVSFISLKLIFPALYPLLREGGEIACLIKPQFEAGREKVGKKGVVRDPAVHLEVLQQFLRHAKENNFTVLGITYSPIRGPEGNIEYLGFLRKSDEPDTIPELSDVVAASHDELKD